MIAVSDWKNNLLFLFILAFALTLALTPALFSPPVVFASGDGEENALPPISINLDGLTLLPDVPPVIEDGRVLVPLRLLFEALGAQVQWFEETRQVEARWKEFLLKLEVDSVRALLNGQPVMLDVPARIREGRTLVPLRFVAESLGLQVHWEPVSRFVYLNTGLLRYLYIEKEFTALRPLPEKSTPENHLESPAANETESEREAETEIEDNSGLEKEPEDFTEQLDKNNDIPEGWEEYSYPVQVHAIRLSPALKSHVALAGGAVGRSGTLLQMAKSQQAYAAITGTYFNYLGNHPDPYGTIISGGQVVHLGNEGTTAAFYQDGRLLFHQLQPSVRGTINGSSDPGWLAFGINHTTQSDKAVTYLYTPARGEYLGFAHGTSVVVDRGRVIGIYENENVAIPPQGFVINFTDWHQGYAKNFQVGDFVEYAITFCNHLDQPFDVGPICEALTCWPVLVTDGAVSTWSGTQRTARTALILRGDVVYLAASPWATPGEFAEILIEYLGADQALNLDGGGSAGLYLYGNYLVQPGRRLSNALIFK